jgi:hypothetical protein
MGKRAARNTLKFQIPASLFQESSKEEINVAVYVTITNSQFNQDN